MPLMLAFNSRVRGAEANGSVPFTRGEIEGRLRGAQSYAEEAARGTRGGGCSEALEEDDSWVGPRGLHS
jgi:hypothetical protein